MAEKKKRDLFAWKIGQPRSLYGVFYRKTPKADPKFLCATGDPFTAILFEVDYAKRRKIPRRKLNVTAYTGEGWYRTQQCALHDCRALFKERKGKQYCCNYHAHLASLRRNRAKAKASNG